MLCALHLQNDELFDKQQLNSKNPQTIRINTWHWGIYNKKHNSESALMFKLSQLVKGFQKPSWLKFALLHWYLA